MSTSMNEWSNKWMEYIFLTVFNAVQYSTDFTMYVKWEKNEPQQNNANWTVFKWITLIIIIIIIIICIPICYYYLVYSVCKNYHHFLIHLGGPILFLYSSPHQHCTALHIHSMPYHAMPCCNSIKVFFGKIDTIIH